MKEYTHETEGEKRMVGLSECEAYRYYLRIIWNPNLPRIQFVGLNPSTADHLEDDQTMRKVKSFSRSWGYGSLVMTNLFAFRSRDPSDLYSTQQPIGEVGNYVTPANLEFKNANDLHLWTEHHRCGEIIACWGTNGAHLYRGVKVKQILTGMKCLRRTKEGHPEHPLYLPLSLTPIPFN